MKERKWPIRLAAAGLVLCTMGGVVLAAQQGSEGDPLVTLSYLTDTFTPSVLSQVDSKVAKRESALKESLQEVADGYAEEVKGAGGGSGTGTSSAVYEIVTLTKGQKLTAGSSCEILLRSGTATCVSDSAPGLVDMTDGTTLAGGGSLKANHLYLATIKGRGVQASSAVTLMVRGDYTVA